MWHHPTIGQNAATRADDLKIFERDKAQCDYESTASTQTVDYGYRSKLGQEIDRADRRNELRKLCMKARGYTWGPAQPAVADVREQWMQQQRKANP
jgi:hypothetical protein